MAAPVDPYRAERRDRLRTFSRARRAARPYQMMLLSALALGICVWAVVPVARGGGDGIFLASEVPTTEVENDRRLQTFKGELFSQDQRRNGAVIFHCLGLLYTFVSIAIVCDEFFVPALEVISERLELTPNVAGATFMAAGGSAPEFFTSLIGTVIVETDIGIGTVVGSAVFNVLFVIGACAIMSPTALELTWFPLARDACFYIVDLCVLTVVFYDARVRLFEAMLLFCLYVAYTSFMKFSDRVEQRLTTKKSDGEDPGPCWAKSRETGDPATAVTHEDSQNMCDVVVLPTTIGADMGGTGQPSLPSPVTLPVVSDGTGSELARQVSGKDPARENSKQSFRHKSVRCAANNVTAFSADQAQSPRRSALDRNKESRPPDEMPGHDNKPEPLGNSQSQSVEGGTGGLVNDSTGGSGSESQQYIPCEPMVDNEVKAPAGQGEYLSVLPTTRGETPTDVDDDDDDDEDDEDDEDNEPLDLYPPGPDASAIDWAWYLTTIPIVAALVCTIPDVRRPHLRWLYAVSFSFSILWIGFFTYVMVWFARIVCVTVNMSEDIMGLTVLAAGTSVPDLLSSVIVARQGQGDMAISSSIGSNIFDVTVCLPIPWIIYHLKEGAVVQVTNTGLGISVLLLMLMVVFTVANIHVNRWAMTKLMGFQMIFLYVIFEIVQVLMVDTIPTDSLPSFLSGAD